MSSRPPASDKIIDLYSFLTPNGAKVNVALEELIAAGSPVTYASHQINIMKNEQKEDWFLKGLNPNGRIPAIHDNQRDFAVFESGAILLYLQKHYDPDFALGFEDDNLQSEMIQWIFFQHGGLGPMQGQAGWFLSQGVSDNPTKDKFAAKRYINETKRLYQVYEDRLANGREYLVGPGPGKFTYADAVTFTWIRAHPYSLGFTSLAKEGFPNLDAYVKRCESRPAVAKALKGDMIEQMRAKDDFEESIAKRSAWVWEEEKARDEL